MPIKSIQKYEIQMIIEYFILFFCFFVLNQYTGIIVLTFL